MRLAAYFLCRALWRHGRSRDETKYMLNAIIPVSQKYIAPSCCMGWVYRKTIVGSANGSHERGGAYGDLQMITFRSMIIYRLCPTSASLFQMGYHTIKQKTCIVKPFDACYLYKDSHMKGDTCTLLRCSVPWWMISAFCQIWTLIYKCITIICQRVL